MTASATPKVEMGWVHPVDGDRTFILQAEGGEVGRLQFADDPAGPSLAEFHGRRWTFQRTGPRLQSIVVLAAGKPVAEFTHVLGGGGVVAFASGHQFAWTREHLWSARWCFRSKQQKSAVCVTQEAGALMRGGKVAVCSSAAGREETPVLILLAWYLRILEVVELSESVPLCP